MYHGNERWNISREMRPYVFTYWNCFSFILLGRDLRTSFYSCFQWQIRSSLVHLLRIVSFGSWSYRSGRLCAWWIFPVVCLVKTILILYSWDVYCCSNDARLWNSVLHYLWICNARWIGLSQGKSNSHLSIQRILFYWLHICCRNHHGYKLHRLGLGMACPILLADGAFPDPNWFNIVSFRSLNISSYLMVQFPPRKSTLPHQQRPSRGSLRYLGQISRWRWSQQSYRFSRNGTDRNYD